MATCSFCACTIPKGTGKLYVKKDGRTLYFCSLKCEKNTIELGRKARETTWTHTAQALKKTAKKAVKK